MRLNIRFLLLPAVGALLLSAQEPPTPSTEPPAGGAPGGAGAAAGRAQTTPEPRPYEKVVTKEFKTDDGVFKVHVGRDRVLYEIPKREISPLFLWVSQIRRTTIGAGYGGQMLGNRVVRWELRDRKVFLRSVNFEVVAAPSQPIARAVRDANEDAIIMAFNVEAFNKEGDPVIDVTRLFTTDVPEFSARVRLRARAMDTARSYVDKAVSFPINIEVDAVQTYTTPIEPPTGMGGGPTPTPAPSPFAASMRPGTGTVTVHYSMVKLPENPMMPRVMDERVGYFSVTQTDYGRPEHKADKRSYIDRWRLEKKDPNSALSDPVKPIVYYVDPATPVKWIPFVKRGIEAWQPAFAEAGFRNAIVAKDPPTKEEDPDWSPEDARYSVVRWLPSTIENAVGPNVHDPRTGEILESDIQIYHNVMNLATNWYFVQASPLDPRAQKLPLSDELMGKLVEYVVAHEVGHTLGLPHNFKASSLYPVEKVRDREWVKKMGHTPTLMDYSRFNYVAQPEDKIDPADLIPKIGPYDTFAIVWGYKPVPGAKTPDEEKPTLDKWAAAQVDTPYLRFSTSGALGADPGEEAEAVGDADAVVATGLGLKNLERVSTYLLQATEKDGEDWDTLKEVYGRLLGQWSLEMGHVANIVGGMNSQELVGGQKAVRFRPLAKERQQAAVKFLMDNAFVVPKWALDPEVLRRIEPDGAVTRVRAAQQRVLVNMMSPARWNRLVEQEALDPAKAYAPAQFMVDVRLGVFKELSAPQVKIDTFRRNTQRLYLETLGDKLNSRTPATDDARALVRSELKTLSGDVTAALPKAADRVTRAHLEDVKDQVAKILDPKFAPPVPATPAGQATGRPGLDPFVLDCWFEQ